MYNLHPSIHYIRYSITGISNTAFDSLSEDLVNLCGRYVKKKVKNSNKKEIWIKEYSRYGVTLVYPRQDNGMTATLAFPITIDLEALIDILIKYYWKSPYSSNSNHNISSIEIKFDFKINSFEPNIPNKLANFFMKYLYPKFPKVCFSKKYIDTMKFKGDYLLGDETLYFYPCSKGTVCNMNEPKRAKKGTFFKMYTRGKLERTKETKGTKRYELEDIFDPANSDEDMRICYELVWLLRFEIRFKKGQLETLLKKYDGFDFASPYDLPRVINPIYNTKFTDYFEFCTINLSDFITHLKKLLNQKDLLTPEVDIYLNRLLNKDSTKMDIYHFMKKLCRIFKQDYLYSKAKKYIKIRTYDELERAVRKKLGLDLSTDLTYLT